MRRIRLALLLSAPLATACGGPAHQHRKVRAANHSAAGGVGGTFYAATVLKQADITPDQFKAVEQSLPKKLSEHTLLLEDAKGNTRPVEVKDVEAAGKLALYYALTSGEDGWSEIDVRIRLADDRRVPVSLWRGDGDNLKIRIGPVGEKLARGHGDDLQDRYGIGPLREAGATWSPRAREVLDLALDAVADRERKILAGIPFIRQPRGVDPAHGALYHQVNCAADIFFYDNALHADGDQFVGEPESPLPSSVRTLLHEVGHALHQRPSRAAMCKLEKEEAAFNARVAEYNHRADTLNREQGKMSAKERQHETDWLKTETKEIAADRKSVEEHAKEAKLMAKEGPVLESYLHALGDETPPTAYAETSPAESFAESYSLYRTDPAALKRLLPAVFEYFERGEHLNGL